MTKQKILYLVRHAKSSLNQPGLADHLRILEQRGENDALEMGLRTAKQAVQPKQIISSPAVRAVTTATLMAQQMRLDSGRIVTNDEIYLARVSEMLKIIQQFDNQYNCIMLVGHNPTMTELIDELTDSEIENVPTCGVAMIQVNSASWHETGKVSAEMLYFDYPKNLF